jgi:membrane peptidoglycan carboxypeptidase
VRRLGRLILIVCLTGAVLAIGVTALAVIGDDVVHRSATATDARLPPLSQELLHGSTIYADDGSVLAVEQGAKLSEPVPISKIPKVLINAVLDTEDAHFYTHGGFDIPSTLRAAASDSSPGDQFQGGSTIAQQLVKQTYLTSQRKLSRKVKEAVLADRLEKEYTKDQILDAYLNIVYLGSGAYGVQAAANIFFNEDVGQLTLPQAALLAGNIQSPTAYDPISNPTGARVRRSQVLARMLKERSITPAEAAAANVSPLPTSTTKPPTPPNTTSNSYVQQVVSQLLGADSPLGSTYQERYEALYEGGLKIYTNYDPNLEAAAEGAVAGDVPADATADNLEEALVAIDPSTGKVRAIVGGSTDFDIATQGGRQPGSGFKIFTLLAALQQGYSINSAVDATAPCAIAFPPSATGISTGDDDLLLHPAENDEGPGSGGETTIANATAQSYNCAFLRIAHEIKLTSVISMARQLGITGPLPAVPAMVLGSEPVSPLEMAAAYATVADGGVYHTPSFIDHIVDRSGATIYTGEGPGKQVVSPEIAAQATTAFRDVVTYGTGTSAAVPGHDVAGKTGTASGPVDAWFNGFTPQLATSVWMGNPNQEVKMDLPDIGEVYGGTLPAKTFRDFMASALLGQPNAPLTVLSGGEIPPGKPVSSPGLTRDDKYHPAPPKPAPVAAPTPMVTPTSVTTPDTSQDTTPVTVPATAPDTAPVTVPATTPVTVPVSVPIAPPVTPGVPTAPVPAPPAPSP